MGMTMLWLLQGDERARPKSKPVAAVPGKGEAVQMFVAIIAAIISDTRYVQMHWTLFHRNGGY